MRLRLLIPLLLWPGLAFSKGQLKLSAKSCSTQFNLPEFLTEPRDQNNVGWCYAYAAADLVSAHVGQKVSAADLALNENFHKKNESFRAMSGPTLTKDDMLKEAGNENAAIEHLLDSNPGFCLEKDLPSDPLRITVLDPETKMTKTGTLSVKDRLLRSIKNPTPFSMVNCPQSAIARQTFPHVPQDELYETIQQMEPYKGDNRTHTLKLWILAQKACQGRRIPSPFQKKEIKLTRPFDVDKLDQLLQKGQVATVTIPFKQAINRLSPQEREAFELARTSKTEAAGGHHSMLLAGRRWNAEKNVCEYIFKNSWGRDDNADRRTLRGYTIVPETELRAVQNGYSVHIDKKPSWKKAPLPEFLK